MCHRLITQGLCPASDKVMAVSEFRISTNTRLPKEFLVLAGYYRRLIPNFNKIAKPLAELLKESFLFFKSNNR